MVFVPVTLHQLLSSLLTFFQVSAATTDHVLIQGFNCSNEGEDWPKGHKGLGLGPSLLMSVEMCFCTE